MFRLRGYTWANLFHHAGNRSGFQFNALFIAVHSGKLQHIFDQP
jgi:hypothetical protein